MMNTLSPLHPLLVEIILDNIFHFLTKKQLIQCSLVCRTWNNNIPTSIKRFEWQTTNEIFTQKMSKVQFAKKSILDFTSFCRHFGCSLTLRQNDQTKKYDKLIITSSNKTSICVDLKTSFDRCCVTYFKLPDYLSTDGDEHHFAIVNEIIAVDFSDFNNITIYDIANNAIDSTKKRSLNFNENWFCSRKTVYQIFSSFNVSIAIYQIPFIDKSLLRTQIQPNESNFATANLKISNNDVIFGSEFYNNKVSFVIFDKLNITYSKVIDLSSVKLNFDHYANSYIFCNRYLMVLAKNGFCIFDCHSDSDEPIMIESNEETNYFAAHVTLTKNHFICFVGSTNFREFKYLIFDMNKKIYKVIPNYYENFFSKFRVEQVNDEIVIIHTFEQGDFVIDLNLMTLTSTKKEKKNISTEPMLRPSIDRMFSCLRPSPILPRLSPSVIWPHSFGSFGSFPPYSDTTEDQPTLERLIGDFNKGSK